MARKQNSRSLREGKYVMIGAGLTEKYYFYHLKSLISLPIDIRPRMFGKEDIATLQKRIELILQEGQIALCVFDADVSTWNKVEKERLKQLKNKYKTHKSVHIFTSLPSIEYWFLLHFENTNHFYATSDEAIADLRKYILNFDKHIPFLEKEKWVQLLTTDNRLEAACKRAETFIKQADNLNSISYTELYKLFQLLIPQKKS